MEVTTPIIIVFCLCGLVVIIVIVILCIWYCHRTGKRKTEPARQAQLPTVSCNPIDGRSYPSPLTVRLINNNPNVKEIYVKIIHESHANYGRYASLRGGSPNQSTLVDVSMMGSGGPSPSSSAPHSPRDDNQVGYLLYRSALTLVEPGSYVVRAHTLNRGEADIQHFYYHVEAPNRSMVVIPRDDNGDEMPLLSAPLIVPAGGEITSSTAVKIIVEDETGYTGREMIKYSTDGTFPARLYTGPFTIPVPPRSNFHDCVIRAVIYDGVSASPEAVAHLRVLPGAALIFDPSIPAPSAQVDAVGALLYFEPPVESNCVVHFRIEYTKDRHSSYVDVDASAETQIYDDEPFLISADVARILAWTVPTWGGTDGLKRSDAAVYDVSLQKLTRISKTKRGRLAAPVICVTCNDLYLTFDDPPAALVLMYTLDGTEPSIGEDNHNTHRYSSGSKPIDVSKCEYKTLLVTARYFTSNVLGGDNHHHGGGVDEVVRFGEKFSRGFHFEE